MYQITLQAARINRGYSRFKAAYLLKISIFTLYSWEKGWSYPEVEQYLDLCRIYRCPVDIIFLPL